MILLCALAAIGRAQPTQLQLQAVPPAAPDVASLSARTVGPAGAATLFYWIVARYPGGYSVQMVPAAAIQAPAVSQLSGSWYVRVTWAAVSGATGYDVLRAASPAYPAPSGSCGACAVVVNTTATTVNDTGGVLSAFPSGGLQPAVGGLATFTMDTGSQTYPFINVGLMSRSVESLRLGLLSGLFAENDCVKWSGGRLVSAGAACGSGGGGTPGGSNGQVQYNSAGAFAGSPWVASGNDLIPPAAGTVAWSGRSILSTPADGYFLVTNAAGTDFTCFALGGTSASYPAWCRSTTELRARTADNASYVPVRASGYIVDGASASNCLLAGGTTGSCGGAGYQQAVLLDLKPSITAPTVLSIDGGRCSGQTKVASTATITAGAGNGSFVTYCTNSQTIVVETSSSAGITVSCSNCVPLTVTTPEVPSGLFPIGSGTITTGQWATLSDDRDWDTRLLLQDGLGIDINCSGGHTCTIANDAAVVQLLSANYTPLAEFDAAAATRTRLKTGAADPGTCAVGDLFFNSTASAGQNLKGCTSLNTYTTIGSSALSLSGDLYWPWYLPAGTSSTHNPGANVQRTWTFTPVATYTVTAFRYVTSGNTGYTAWAITDYAGTATVTNATARCNNAAVSGGTPLQCSWAGSVTLTAGTRYRLVGTADASNGWSYANDLGNLAYNNGTDIGFTIGGAKAFGDAANAATGAGATLAVSVPLGAITGTASIAALTPPTFVMF